MPLPPLIEKVAPVTVPSLVMVLTALPVVAMPAAPELWTVP